MSLKTNRVRKLRITEAGRCCRRGRNLVEHTSVFTTSRNHTQMWTFCSREFSICNMNIDPENESRVERRNTSQRLAIQSSSLQRKVTYGRARGDERGAGWLEHRRVRMSRSSLAKIAVLEIQRRCQHNLGSLTSSSRGHSR